MSFKGIEHSPSGFVLPNARTCLVWAQALIFCFVAWSDPLYFQDSQVEPTFPNPLASFYVQAVLFRAFREFETDPMGTSCSERVFVMSKHAPSSLLIPVSMLSLDRLLLLIICSDPPSQHNRKSTASLYRWLMR